MYSGCYRSGGTMKTGALVFAQKNTPSKSKPEGVLEKDAR